MTPERGEIWLVNYSPKVDPELGTFNASLIISNNTFNAIGADLCLVVPLTRKKIDNPFVLELKPGGTQGLREPVYAHTHLVRSVSQARLARKIGRLTEFTSIQEIRKLVLRLL
jgi:mRNA-degrading endonuclease toxin of MazEF toxin-antitoxin module